MASVITIVFVYEIPGLARKPDTMRFGGSETPEQIEAALDGVRDYIQDALHHARVAKERREKHQWE